MKNANKTVKIIGNNNSGATISDGGRIKIRLYQSLLNEENIKTGIIDLNQWKKRFLKIIKQIKIALRNKETIVIMAGPNGSRVIVPIVYRLNKKYKSRVVFCPVGIGTIDKTVRGFSPTELTNFLLCRNFYGKKDKKFSKYLSSFSKVILENKVLEECYKQFYKIDNTFVLTNFRVYNGPQNSEHNSDANLHCVFLSRVCLEKGVLDLVDCVNEINYQQDQKIFLDIFGDIQLKNKADLIDKTNEFVHYCGVVDQNDCYNVLSKYDLFVLPTKYHGEGTPGSLVESLISGTPVLLSKYSQSNELIIDGYNGFLFELNSINDLKTKLLEIASKKDKLTSMRQNVIETSKKYIYKYIKDDFIKVIGGVEK